MERRYALDGGESEIVTLVRRLDHSTLRLSGAEHDVALHTMGGGRSEVIVDGRVVPVSLAKRADTVYLHAFGRAWEIDVGEDSAHSSGGPSSADAVLAPMPGTVVSLHCEAGQVVEAGQVLAVIESMKLQTELAAPRDGIVDRILARIGDTFDRDAPLVTLQGEDKED